MLSYWSFQAYIYIMTSFSLITIQPNRLKLSIPSHSIYFLHLKLQITVTNLYDIFHFIPNFYNPFTTLLGLSSCDIQLSTVVPSLKSQTGLPLFLLHLNWYTEHSLYEATNLLCICHFLYFPYPHIIKYLLSLQTQFKYLLLDMNLPIPPIWYIFLFWICRAHYYLFLCVFFSLIYN